MSDPPPAALSLVVVASGEPPGVPARAAPRVRAAGASDSDDVDSSGVDPGAPVVSAAAIGTDAIAEPTPNATASAPTRPTNRA
jgi:hypothetical protein